MLAISGLRVEHAVMNLATAKAEECNVNSENLMDRYGAVDNGSGQDSAAMEVNFVDSLDAAGRSIHRSE
jgi:hypothetical protein